jgi:hypothetical protein
MNRFNNRRHSHRCRKYSLRLGVYILHVAVMQKIATGTQGAPSVHGHIAGDLLHPWFVRMGCDARDIDAAALKVNEEST